MGQRLVSCANGSGDICLDLENKQVVRSRSKETTRSENLTAKFNVSIGISVKDICAMTTATNKSLFLSSFYRVKANDLVLFGVLLLGIVGTATAMQKRVGGMNNVKSFQDADAGISAEDRTQIEGFLKNDKVSV